MSALADEVAQIPLWYHTLELAPGVLTPGWMDLRAVVDDLPWPDVRGKRCLDIGTYDGFFAFEMERRGAAEVVATDITDHSQWDWSREMRSRGAEYLRAVAGPEKGAGFEVARRALGSTVVKHEISVYDLSPERLGFFDVVVCGSLLLHLKNPIAAVEAIRSVCRGLFMSAEQIDPLLSITSPRRPATRFRGGSEAQWHVPNVQGHRAIVSAGGFEPNGSSHLYAVPYGPAHPSPRRDLRGRAASLGTRLVTRGRGVPHAAFVAQPGDDTPYSGAR